jgi:RNA polymerase primary sigma factor
MRQLKITQQITLRDTKSLNSYLTEVSAMGDTISQEEEVELSKRILEGDQSAVEKLVNANLRFVISVAKQYQTPGTPLIDLINEGNIGLITAAQRFDHTRGFKFISYAVWWIRQSILQYLSENSKAVRLPGNKQGQIRKINNEASRLEQELERTPTIDELAERMSSEFTAEQISKALQFDASYSSLDAPVADESSTRLSDMMENDYQDSKADHITQSQDLEKSLSMVIDKMSTREAYVIKCYYGILGHPKKSLEEIGADLHLTRERIRQIQKKAERRLRLGSSRRLLKDYI